MSEPLYAIIAKYQEDLARLQDLDLPPEVVLDTIEAMQGAVEEKVRAVVAYALDLEKAAEVRRAEAQRMNDGAEAMERRAESLKTYAQIALMNSGLRLPLVAPEFTLNLAKLPPSVEVLNIEALPDSMVKTTVTLSFPGRCPSLLDDFGLPDNTKVESEIKAVKKPIGDSLKAGIEVPGAKLAPVAYRLAVR